MRTLLPAREPPLLMAKIEKRGALDELEAIVAAAEDVMVARGDLGVETELAEIPLVEKRIIASAREIAAVLVIARPRPRAPIVIFTPFQQPWNSLAMVRGVVPMHCADTAPDAWLEDARTWLFSRGPARHGDPVVLLFSGGKARGG